MRTRGFTLIEVLVALVIVAFGMGALLSTLTHSAGYLSALRDKSAAQWLALNEVAFARLNLQAPATGTVEGEVTNFGAANWHYQEVVSPVQLIPGLLAIIVRVRHSDQAPTTSSSACTDNTTRTIGANSLGSGALAPPTTLGGTTTLGSTLGSSGSVIGINGPRCLPQVTVVSHSSFVPADVTALLSALSGTTVSLGNTSSTDSGKQQSWVVTVVGFRGDAIDNASGDDPNWAFQSGIPGADAGGTNGSTNNGNATVGNPQNGTGPGNGTNSRGGP